MNDNWVKIRYGDVEMPRYGQYGVQWSLVKVTALTSHVACVFVFKSASCIWSLSPSNMKFHIGGMGNLTTLCADHR